ncbi:TPA: hypothetical protein P0E27_001689 [Vibrio harveyi]|nr:hypothetical protein [Vibrio harveyi]
MNVDVNMSKFPIYIGILISFSVSAEQFSIFEREIKLNEDCTVDVINAGNLSYSQELSDIGDKKCSFIKFGETSLIHLERFNDKYVVLVESQSFDNKECTSRYGALIFRRDKSVELINWFKKSGSCGADRERRVFEYFVSKSVQK